MHEGSSPMRVVVVGLGMVGIAFVEKLLNRDDDHHYLVTIIGEEPHLAYNRVGLTQYFNNRSVEALLLNPLEWYQSHEPGRLAYHTADRAVCIDTAAKLVKTEKTEIPYDICVMATGSNAALPPYVTPERQRDLNGCFVYRNIADLDAMIAYGDSGKVQRAAVIGGGLLGLEAAKAILDLESVPGVTLVERNDWVLARQLDADAGRMVLDKVRSLNVDVLLNTRVKDMAVKKNDLGKDILTGLELESGDVHDCQMVIFAVGITPRDELAKVSGIETHPRGGIVVKDDLMTSAPDVYAIGECANWHGETYGLIAPGIEMADVLSFNMTEGPKHKMRTMTSVDLSTKLKLMGVDVASFGDFFADRKGISNPVPRRHGKRTAPVEIAIETPISSNAPSNGMDSTSDLNQHLNDAKTTPTNSSAQTVKASAEIRKTTDEKGGTKRETVKCLTYHDPFSSVYKKYLFTADGKYLLGGMMIGDTSDYVKLVSMVKSEKPLDIAPGQLIIGVPKKEGEEEGVDLHESTQVCSCHNVSKGAIMDAVKNGCTSLGEVKSKTKCGTGCGGCMPLATSIFNMAMKKAGNAISNHICPHFRYSRADLFNVVKIKKLSTFGDVMREYGVKSDAIGCEVCKPVLASIFASLYNEFIVMPVHHQNQDTNDKYLANMQRNGTYSVIPRIAGGEITPARLRRIGEVAEQYGLYTKITGGQRIDMFGAQKQDLPDIWEKLIEVGLETGQAYGKSLRTVKSCVGTTWCRYGIGDSVKMAIELETRYKGIRSPHKIKGGVSGCVRECAEAQSKDFGLIATDKGWNVFVAGNGGAKPRHATLLARDVPKSKAIRLVDRFLMFYIRTADKLTRTARWIENMEGGIDYLRKVIIDDEIGICEQLDKEMDGLVGTFFDEWAAVVKDPERRKQFRQFANTKETQQSIEKVKERGQERPEYWPREHGALIFRTEDITVPPSEWEWIKVCQLTDLHLTQAGTTSVAIKYGDTQLAIYHVPGKGLYASQNMCPHKRAFVLSDGIVGDDLNGNVYVSCPMHKRNYSLETNLKGGKCLNDSEYGIVTFEVKSEGDSVYLKLPSESALDAVLATSKFVVRRAQEMVRDAGTSEGSIEIVGPSSEIEGGLETKGPDHAGGVSRSGDDGRGLPACGTKLEW